MDENSDRHNEQLPEHKRISDLVDGMEARITAEREARGVEGNRADREEVESVEPEDQAPE
ncbi:MAG: hypothetical protein WAW17_13865 [Rhodococcus sp. (in: high G+C Gram-positive bacteria)]|uniref:hypothetical protein n=1 Tax=Rhodococcus sp. TaxID=1831 RepID=UPI003BB1F1DB